MTYKFLKPEPEKLLATILLFIPASYLNFWNLLWDDIQLGGNFWELCREMNGWGISVSILIPLILRAIIVLVCIYLIVCTVHYIVETYKKKK